MQKLNTYDYSGAIADLEPLYQKHPNDREVALMLAQAHLGESGLGMYELVNRVFARASENGTLNVDLTRGANCPQGELTKFDGVEIRCIVARVLANLPSVESPHLFRAREVLRAAFPTPDRNGSDVNFLAAFVEVASALTRVRAVMEREDLELVSQGRKDEERFGFYVHHLKNAIEETLRAAEFIRYSYGKLKKFVVQLDGKPIMKVGEDVLVFDENLSSASLIDFLEKVVASQASGATEHVRTMATRFLSNAGVDLIYSLRQAGMISAEPSESDPEILKSWFNLGTFVRDLIEGFSDGLIQMKIFDVSDLAAENPPQILRGLRAAAREAWETEKLAPLLAWRTSTLAGWKELKVLQASWLKVWKRGLTEHGRKVLALRLKRAGTENPALRERPENTAAALAAWQNLVSETFFSAFLETIVVPGAWTTDQGNRLERDLRSAQELIQRTKIWMGLYLWSAN